MGWGQNSWKPSDPQATFYCLLSPAPALEGPDSLGHRLERRGPEGQTLQSLTSGQALVGPAPPELKTFKQRLTQPLCGKGPPFPMTPHHREESHSRAVCWKRTPWPNPRSSVLLAQNPWLAWDFKK